MNEKNLGIIVATVIEAVPVPGTQRLHRILLDAGGGKQVQIASGIAGDFAPGYLVGKQVPILVDVSPIKVRGVLSEARFLATKGNGGKPVLLCPVEVVPSGVSVF
jgi:tRNA-binding EMAP/Myf-like protein